MSPKSKKQSKTPTKFSQYDAVSSPRTPSSVTSTPPSDLTETELLSSLEEASRRFRSLIGSSTLIGRVADVEAQQRGCTIWVSESSMVASSLVPGSIVSVSLAASDRNSSSNFPLSSLRAECNEHFKVDCPEDDGDKAGNYFVLATAFPSSKVLKNEVRISSNLSNSMGCPTSGRIVFVYPIFSGSPISPLYMNNKLDSLGSDHLSLCFCREVYLELIPPNPAIFSTSSSSTNPFDIRDALMEESSKKLLEHYSIIWLSCRVLLCGNIVTISVLTKLFTYRVVHAEKASSESSDAMNHGEDAFIVDRSTKIHLCLPSYFASDAMSKKSSTSELEGKEAMTNVQDGVPRLGGLWKEYAALKDIISLSVKNSLSSFGLRTKKGVLLHGPPGTGKTSLAKLCAYDAGVNLFKVNGPEFISQYYGESEQALNEVFKQASQAAPSVIFIDELDAIAPARKEGGEELSQRVVATLLNLMDGINATDGLLIIAATNRIDSIEPALRRPGRLDREIELGVPSSKQRLDILLVLLSKMQHSLSSEQIQHLSVVTHGFVGADLAALSNEAAMVCLRRYVKWKNSHDNTHSDEISPTCNGFLEASIEDRSLKVTFEDFEKARMKVRPSGMREVILEVPRVKWEEVGGQSEVKTQLMEAVEWPQKHRDAFKRIGVRPPTGVLMFGPPGCSKTLMARAVASEAGLNFLSVKGPELFSKWVGESEKAVRSVFAKARANAPSIIFFDEIDSLAVVRGRESDGVSVADRVMSQLLVELDGLHQRVDVTVIAATNRPDKIDPALLRPGRFDRLLYVGPPSETDREDIFRIHLRKMPCSSDVNTRELARLSDGCTGADVSLICREAAIAALEENINAWEIKMRHLKNAIRHVRPSEIEQYEELSKKFQRLVHLKKDSDELANKQSQSSSANYVLSWNPLQRIARFLYRFLAPEI